MLTTWRNATKPGKMWPHPAGTGCIFATSHESVNSTSRIAPATLPGLLRDTARDVAAERASALCFVRSPTEAVGELKGSARPDDLQEGKKGSREELGRVQLSHVSVPGSQTQNKERTCRERRNPNAADFTRRRLCPFRALLSRPTKLLISASLARPAGSASTRIAAARRKLSRLSVSKQAPVVESLKRKPESVPPPSRHGMGDLAVFRKLPSDVEKHLYLRKLRTRDEASFWRLLMTHTDELMPIVYTPTVGACNVDCALLQNPSQPQLGASAPMLLITRG